ncbi:GNAT family N-acetyltransferase [Entomobacter blattae]|uniref:Acetyltransferase (GNAT) domain protein n=1 Tax=Entomobacter blattae TaxID=2762277 RepID=A0A7H1NR02_9PROT|nr:GNAT family N-acetyltransferase [Entomobacter blattae]QNT78212.1 Acetyltransferase (GNAT) domain protein [Entomobacter blattae]
MVGSSSLYSIKTARLLLTPVNWQDMAHISQLKADAASFGQMLGGVRNRLEAEQDMAEDISFWAQHKVGIFTIWQQEQFVGITGLHQRPDGRGIGLRFALWAWARGKGYAREAASAALWFGHGQGIERIVAVARKENVASCTILGSIGMQLCNSFVRAGHIMQVYESDRSQAKQKILYP